MTKRIEQRLLDTNALVMGGGVGLAALESMFNLVQTQSLLSASMVRDHDLSGSLAVEALALAIGEILDPGLYAACRTCKPVRVDIPKKEAPSAAPESVRSAAPPPAPESVSQVSHEGQETSHTEVHTNDPVISIDTLLTEMFSFMKEMNDGYRESNRRTLVVT